jgi:hypothetical protein
MNTLKQLEEISSELPVEILEDINKRINDWINGGGKEDHPYIEQQLRYAKQFID